VTSQWKWAILKQSSWRVSGRPEKEARRPDGVEGEEEGELGEDDEGEGGGEKMRSITPRVTV
jgi:hypothetical protein